jgi:UDP-N-acetylmuramoylalanine--D-glutamate ligase
LPHRLEHVRGGYYDDSKATNPESTIVALQAFPGRELVWLAGGRDKGTDLSELCEAAKRYVTKAVLFGEAQDRFQEALRWAGFEGQILCFRHMQQALEASLAFSEEVVVLSPACASFDEFPDYESRGSFFRQWVEAHLPADLHEEV